MSFIYSQRTSLLVKQPTVALLLYGREGIGKTYFASKFPKPFFINTDRNLRYLMQNKSETDEFDGVIVSQWSAPDTATDEEKSTGFANVVEELAANKCFGYKTIVIDLVEQVYDFCLKHVCAINQIDHPSEARKVWAILYDTFVNTINTLRACDVNLILLSHEIESTEKDAIGREITCYWPALQDKVMRRLSGSGYVLRCYWKQQVNGSTVESVRMLSLEPKPNEVHVTRFISPDGQPIALNDIPLDYDRFMAIFDDIKTGKLTSAYKVVTADSQLAAGKTTVAANVKTIVKQTPMMPRPTPPPAKPAATAVAAVAKTEAAVTQPAQIVQTEQPAQQKIQQESAKPEVIPQKPIEQIKPVDTVTADKPKPMTEQLQTDVPAQTETVAAVPLSSNEILAARAKQLRDEILRKKGKM